MNARNNLLAVCLVAIGLLAPAARADEVSLAWKFDTSARPAATTVTASPVANASKVTLRSWLEAVSTCLGRSGFFTIVF